MQVDQCYKGPITFYLLKLSGNQYQIQVEVGYRYVEYGRLVFASKEAAKNAMAALKQAKG